MLKHSLLQMSKNKHIQFNTIQDKTNASASFGKSYLILAPAGNWLESKELMEPPNHKPVLQGTYSWDHFSLSS